MVMVLIDGSTLREFVNDEAAFKKEVESSFKQLDDNNDGVLSRSELRPAFERLHIVEAHFGAPEKKTPAELQAIYDQVFEVFDADHNDTVDKAEFLEQMKQIMLAVADGLGNNPLRVLSDEGGILSVAAAHQATAPKKQ